MIDRKELIEGLEYCIKANGKNCPMACPFFKECFSTFESSEPFYPVMHATLELLKEQEPSKPKVIENVHGVKFYYCPRCERPILKSAAYGHPRYCENCGKGLIWE